MTEKCLDNGIIYLNRSFSEPKSGTDFELVLFAISGDPEGTERVNHTLAPMEAKLFFSQNSSWISLFGSNLSAFLGTLFSLRHRERSPAAKEASIVAS